MTRRKTSGLSASVLCVAVAACIWTAQQQAAFAQAKPEAPAAPAQNQPAAAQPPAAQQPATPQPPAARPPITVQTQPRTQPTSVAPLAPAKPIVGPPDPSRPGPEQARGAAPAQPEIPQPTVQLKPGEVPAIKFDAADYNFGRIPAGEQVLHDFWYMNTGNGPLEILSIKPS
jgi:hypothetical protein